MFIISNLNKKDYGKILKIEKTLFINPMTLTELSNFSKQECFYIWKIDIGKIIGYVSFFEIKDEAEIIKIGIEKSYQRKNYGSYVISEMKRMGICFVSSSALSCWQVSNPAISGITISNRIRSGGLILDISIAISPLGATETI